MTAPWAPSETPGSSTKVSVFKSQQHPANSPRNMQSEAVAALSHSILEEQQAYTTIIENGGLWFDGFLNTVVWDKDGSTVIDLCQGHPQIVLNRIRDLEPLELKGRVCLIGNRNPDNYYHWMNDIVPNFEILNLSGIAIEDIDYFVVNSISKRFHTETLEKLGVSLEKIVLTERARYITADELVIPKYGSNTLGMGQGKWAAQYLKRIFGKPVNEVPFRKLYISRGETGPRSVVN